MPYEVAVAGAGIVGLSFACGQRASTALLARNRRAPAPDNGPFDARVYAITPGNADFLERAGAWQRIPAVSRTAILGMRIHGDDGRSLLAFDAYDAGLPALAWIVEEARLQRALWETLASRPQVEVVAPAEWKRLRVDAHEARLTLADGNEIAAQLVVGADGTRSAIRELAGIQVREHAYGHTAVVANFACGRPHRNTALQWFLGGAVLALLPLPGDFVSMVWAASAADAERLLRLDAQELAAETARAARGTLGELALAGRPAAFPLARLGAERLVGQRVALLGDAAHAIHPLAGQGLNLGLQDARRLSAALAARGLGADAGDARVLRAYERGRAEQTALMDWTVHGLFKLFEQSGPLARSLRNAGLNLTDRLPVLKALLMRQAMS